MEAFPIHDRRSWAEDAVVYQIYPRSFADGNSDGVGDLIGARSRLPYLADLGVDAIWLTPFYPSPLRDGGYDISDHRDVDPRLGTLADFDDLVAEAHGVGIRVIVDIVPNHTSNSHPWFQQALAEKPGGPARARYVFRPAAADGSPPTDWRSHFGGSAWEPVGDGDWYLHLFAAEQPDLNWDHPEVAEDFLHTLRFWADRGVDGFRVDVAHALSKDLSEPLRSQPNLDAALPVDGSDPLYDRNEVHAIYRTWRRLFDEYDPPRTAVAETWTPTNERTHLYGRSDELGQVFDFSLLKSGWDAARFTAVIRRSIADHLTHADGGAMTWVLSSHDVVRHASRLALPPTTNPDDWLRSHGREPVVDPCVAARRARAATLLMLALPGSAYLYQGEELGLPEVSDLAEDELHDPIWARTSRQLKGRDGCRVPLPWQADAPSFGFSDVAAWLRQPARFAGFAADVQAGDDVSSLNLYRRAIALRRRLVSASASHPGRTELEWHSDGQDGVLHFSRVDGWHCVVNFTDHDLPRPAGEELLSSGPSQLTTLPAETALWLHR